MKSFSYAALAGALLLAACGGETGSDKAASAPAAEPAGTAAATAPSASAASMEEAPRMRPGKWRTTMTVAAAPEPMVTETCVTEASSKEQTPVRTPEQSCTNVSMRREGGAFVIHAECRMEEGLMTTDQRITGDMQSSYRMETTVRTDPAPPAGAVQTIVLEGTRIGDC